jgi:hypothetical protein
MNGQTKSPDNVQVNVHEMRPGQFNASIVRCGAGGRVTSYSPGYHQYPVGVTYTRAQIDAWVSGKLALIDDGLTFVEA